MLPLLKKSAGKAVAGDALAWRPNFHDPAHLPDTKTVRTKFFVNLVAISIATAVSLLFTLRELKLAGLQNELATVEADIATATAPSAKAVADYTLFKAEEKKFSNAAAVVKTPFDFAEFLMHLGSVLPPGVKIRRVDFRGIDQGLNVSGNVRGLDAAASDVASEFVKKIQADPVFSEIFSSITLPNLGRNVAEGNMSFELVFVFKATAKPGATK